LTDNGISAGRSSRYPAITVGIIHYSCNWWAALDELEREGATAFSSADETQAPLRNATALASHARANYDH
jgi:hypothetical protein